MPRRRPPRASAVPPPAARASWRPAPQHHFEQKWPPRARRLKSFRHRVLARYAGSDLHAGSVGPTFKAVSTACDAAACGTREGAAPPSSPSGMPTQECKPASVSTKSFETSARRAAREGGRAGTRTPKEPPEKWESENRYGRVAGLGRGSGMWRNRLPSWQGPPEAAHAARSFALSDRDFLAMRSGAWAHDHWQEGGAASQTAATPAGSARLDAHSPSLCFLAVTRLPCALCPALSALPVPRKPMCIPFIFVCGEQEQTKSLGQARYCSNCGTKASCLQNQQAGM